MSKSDSVVRLVPCLSERKSSPPSARKLFVVIRYEPDGASAAPFSVTPVTGLGAAAHGLPRIPPAIEAAEVEWRLADGSSTVGAEFVPHHWSLSTSSSCAPVNVCVATMLLNGWIVNASS